MKKITISNDELINEIIVFEENFQSFVMLLNKVSANINYPEIIEEIDFLVQNLKFKLKNNIVYHEYSHYVKNRIDSASRLLDSTVKLLNARSNDEGVFTYNFSYEIGLKLVKNLNSICSIFKSVDEKLESVLLNEIYLKRIDAILDLKKSLILLKQEGKQITKVNKILSNLVNDKYILYLELNDIRNVVAEINAFNSAMFPSENMQDGSFLDEFLNKIKNKNIDKKNLDGTVNKLYYDMYSLYKIRSNIVDESNRLEMLLRDIKNNFINDVSKFTNDYHESTKVLESNIQKTMENFNDKTSSIVEETNRIELRMQEIDSKVINVRNDIINEVDDIKKEARDNIKLIIDDTKKEAKNNINLIVDEVKLKSSLSLSLLKDDIDKIDEEIESYKIIVSDKTTEQLTSVYKKEAKWEKIAYYIFNILSFIVIIIAIIFSWTTLNDFMKKNPGPEYGNGALTFLALRLVVSMIIFSAVVFTSRLASKSYHYWKKNEGIYLRLTALKPFISAMPPEKKIEIHEKLVDVYFGKDDQDQNLNQKIQDLPNNITQLLGKVVDQTSGIIDSAKGNKIIKPPDEDKNV